MYIRLALVVGLVALCCLPACGKKEQYECVCRNLITGSVIKRVTVEGDDRDDAAKECDREEALTLPDRCLLNGGPK